MVEECIKKLREALVLEGDAIINDMYGRSDNVFAIVAARNKMRTTQVSDIYGVITNINHDVELAVRLNEQFNCRRVLWYGHVDTRVCHPWLLDFDFQSQEMIGLKSFMQSHVRIDVADSDNMTIVIAPYTPYTGNEEPARRALRERVAILREYRTTKTILPESELVSMIIDSRHDHELKGSFSIELICDKPQLAASGSQSIFTIRRYRHASN